MKLNHLQVERYKLEDKLTLPPLPGHERYIHPLVGSGMIVTDVADYEITGRRSVFSPPGPGLLLRDDAPVTLLPSGPLDVLVASVPVQAPPTPPVPIYAKLHEIGDGNAKRTVYEILGGDGPAIRLRSGETVNQRGGWSSWPPHSFDKDLTRYTEFEEFFVPFMRPKDGYAIMRRKGKFWSSIEADDAQVLKSGEMVPVPLGSHPIVGAPDTECMYAWFYISPEPKLYGRFAEDLGTYK